MISNYFIYIQRLFHGKLYQCACLTQLKFALEIEYNICKSTNNDIYFMITYKDMGNMISDYINILCLIFS